LLFLSLIVLVCLALSFTADRPRTYQGCRRGVAMLLNILPTLLLVLALVSIFLYLFPKEVLAATLGAKSGFLGVLIAALIGSIALIPPFIAFPLGKILLSQDVPATTVAVFITTLVMVGILTLPLEIKFLGKRAALMRNLLSFIGALVIGLLVGWLY
jgi:uncharacterized membrane protein YraQ (UPF0718 family)